MGARDESRHEFDSCVRFFAVIRDTREEARDEFREDFDCCARSCAVIRDTRERARRRVPTRL
jgi:hypothetical protein